MTPRLVKRFDFAFCTELIFVIETVTLGFKGPGFVENWCSNEVVKT